MTPPLAFLAAGGTALVGNRIIAMAVGVWFNVPALGLLPELILIDVVQIPMFYWIYENSEKVLARLPARLAAWFRRDPTQGVVGRWTSHLGQMGVMILAALPTFGGGMWSAIFLAHGLKLNKRTTYVSLVLGSALSYLVIFWVVDTVVKAIRYFSGT